jgi:hypothetical protein
MKATETRSEFVDLLRETLMQALKSGAREIVLADVDFRDWPLNEPAVVDALTLWTRPHHRLQLLALRFDDVAQRHPRFVQWRRTYDHLVQAAAPQNLPESDFPAMLLTPQAVVEVLDRSSWRARASTEPLDLERCRHQLDALLQRSVPAFSATTLGL